MACSTFMAHLLLVYVSIVCAHRINVRSDPQIFNRLRAYD